MARVCEICGKKPSFGHHVSNANNRTTRRWNPNLQIVRTKVGAETRRLRVCTQCIKSNKVAKA